MMSFNVIEWSALIFSIIAIIKIVILIVSPNILLKMGKACNEYKRLMAVMSGTVSVWLFLELIQSGVSVTTLLAVTLWLSLLIWMGMYRYYI